MLPSTCPAVEDAWNNSLDFVCEGKHLVSCSNSHRSYTSTLSSGNCLIECFFLHLGNNSPITRSSSTCFCFYFMTFKFEEMELIMSILKFLRRFPLFSLVVPPLVDFCACEKTSRSLNVLVLDDTLECNQHKSTIWSKGSLEMSPFPNRLSITKQSSLIPRNIMILRTSHRIVVWPDLFTLYRSLSTKSSKLSSYFALS